MGNGSVPHPFLIQFLNSMLRYILLLIASALAFGACAETPAPDSLAIGPSSETVIAASAAADIQSYKNSPLWKKSRKLRRAAWITLGAGLFVAGGGTLAGCLSETCDAAIIVWTLTWTAGILATAASVPLFVTSFVYAHKAKKAAAKVELNAGPIVTSWSGKRSCAPALGLALNF